MEHHRILRIVTKFNLPLIILFGLYVQFHGDFGPGGGFQAGVIIGAALILYTLVFGLENAARVAPPDVLRRLSLSGVLIYGGTGVANMLLGGDFLDYGSLNPAHTSHGQHYGILLVEFGVGMTVFAGIVTIFCAFAGRAAADVNPVNNHRTEGAGDD